MMVNLNKNRQDFSYDEALPFALSENKADYVTAVSNFRLLLEHRGSRSDVCAYLSRYAWLLEYGFNVLNARDCHFYATLLSSMDDSQLNAFLSVLKNGTFSLKFALESSNRIVSDLSIPVCRRVRFWKLIQSTTWQKDSGCSPQDFIHSGDVFFDNPRFRNDWFRFYAGGSVFDFIEATSVPRTARHLEKYIEDAIADDDASRFAIMRVLMNDDLNSTHDRQVLRFLKKGAWNCFLFVLNSMPSLVYSIRTPAQWLFTIVRNVPDAELAVKCIHEIESRYPGTVANARDFWGNTLLWNTLTRADKVQMPAVQDALIKFGCPANCVNPYGLSFADVQTT